MSYHPRIETSEAASFITTRTRRSELWFCGTPRLEEAILGYLTRFKERYQVKLYAFALPGSHYHCLADFPHLNRAHFTRDLNSCLAKAIPRHLPKHYTGGRPWGRRYSAEIIPHDDLEKQFFYTVLQPVKDGLVEKLSDFPFYNCFHDAIWGNKRKVQNIDWARYNAAKKRNPRVRISDYTETLYLEYDRLPGYEELSRTEYAVMMQKKLENYRQQVIAERQADGKFSFLGRAALLTTVPGTPAMNPKVSTRESHRPRVLSESHERRAFWKAWYFRMYHAYKEASARYRKGELDVAFPPGMYKPLLMCPCLDGP